MAFPVTIPTTPQGYDLMNNPYGTFGGYYGGAHYAFLYQGGFASAGLGDTKLHAFKSTDGGITWVEQDSAGAITIANTAGNATYTVSAPDGNTIWVLWTDSASYTSPGDLYVTSYNLSTDTWSGSTTTISTLPLHFWIGNGSSGTSICYMQMAVLGSGQYLFAFNGAPETVSANPYGRVYEATFDGTTFGTPVMLPGQAGSTTNYTGNGMVLDPAGITHFTYNDNGGYGAANLYHVALAADGVTFGAVSHITQYGEGNNELGTLSLSTVSGTPTLSIAPSLALLSVQNVSFFQAVAVLNPTWTADPGVPITADPTLVPNPNGAWFPQISNTVYTGGKWYVIWSIAPGSSETEGAIYYATSTDDGATWGTPTLLWTAPNTGTGNPNFSSNQQYAYSFSGGVAVAGLFYDALDSGGSGYGGSEIGQFSILGSAPSPSQQPNMFVVT